ncbi:hypothetical protein BDR26DRAFT_893985 [Obelidium mucronatum]|nr:hypothetical protein BDR26DRAFT_893985 [Obelidium mucronatum]
MISASAMSCANPNCPAPTCPPSLKRCPKCESQYCDKSCQQAHHADPEHRAFCKGYTIENTASHGKVLLATRDYNKGDVIFAERPIVLFADNIDMLTQVLQSEEKQRDLMKLYVPSAEALNIVDNDEFYRCIPHQRSYPTRESYKHAFWIPDDYFQPHVIQKLPVFLRNTDPMKIRRLIWISRFNNIGGVGVNLQQEGLFKVASRMEHSCCPNVTVVWEDNQLKCKALEGIERGQRVTFSYLGEGVLGKPKSERQSDLCKYLFLCRESSYRSGKLSDAEQKALDIAEHEGAITSDKQTKALKHSILDDIIYSTRYSDDTHEYRHVNWKGDNNACFPPPSLLVFRAKLRVGFHKVKSITDQFVGY